MIRSAVLATLVCSSGLLAQTTQPASRPSSQPSTRPIFQTANLPVNYGLTPIPRSASNPASGPTSRPAGPTFTVEQVINERGQFVGDRAVINGKPQKTYPTVLHDVARSADGKHLAYVAQVGSPPMSVVVADGVESRPYHHVERLQYNPLGQLIYAGQGDDFQYDLMISGKSVGRYFGVGGIYYSADLKHVAWIAANAQPIHRGQGGFDVYVDGQRHIAEFRNVDGDLPGQTPGFVFSPDGTRWAAWGEVLPTAEQEKADPFNGGIGGNAVMVDGKLGPTFQAVVKGTLQFSADSKHVYYAAGTPRKQDYAIYTDGVAGKMWNWIQPYSLRFSPDGKHLAYIAFTGEQTGNFTGDDPTTHGRNTIWYAGTPTFVKDDQIVDTGCGFFRISADWQHAAWLHSTQVNPPNGPVHIEVKYDGQPIASLGTGVNVKAMVFSPNGQRVATIAERFPSGIVAVDGKTYELPMGYIPSDVICPDEGKLKVYITVAGQARWMYFDPTRGRVATAR